MTFLIVYLHTRAAQVDMKRSQTSAILTDFQAEVFQLEVEQLRMNLPGPEGANELLTDVMRMSHIRFRHVEDNMDTGTGDGHLETGASVGTGGHVGHSLDTVRVKVCVVQ